MSVCFYLLYFVGKFDCCGVGVRVHEALLLHTLVQLAQALSLYVAIILSVKAFFPTRSCSDAWR